MSSRRRSNGASPLINPQRQITSFFAKATSAPSPSPSPSPIPKSNSTPGAATPSPSPLESTPSPAKCYGEEVVGKRIKVLWPADRAWYKGCVKSFNKEKSRHLIQYDDGDEEALDLSVEKFEWLQDTVTNLKRLRRGPLPTTPEPAAAVEKEEEKEESLEDDDDDDSGDEDWGKNAEKEVVEEEEDEAMELEDEEDSDEGVPKSKGKRGGGGGSGKRKLSGGGNLGSAKKTKSAGDVVTNGLKANLIEPASKADSKTAPSKL